MGKMTKPEIVTKLVSAKVGTDLANQYASAFLEYMEAVENIEKIGSVVAHPRTANIIPNPYLKVRDAADKRLLNLRTLVSPKIVDWIWKLWDYHLASVD